MDNSVRIILTFLLAALAPTLPCFAGFTLQINETFAFNKTDMTIEHLDHGDFAGTAATTDWISYKDFVTYMIEPELYWMGKDYYIKAAGNYGWLLNGKVCQYPLGWNANGNTKGFDVETGYIMSVSDRFQFIPFIGYEYDIAYTQINHQHLLHQNPDSFVSQNGVRSYTALYFPYIGVEIDFSSHLTDKHQLQCFASYQFGYGGGHGRKRVPHTYITDNPATSRYGSNTKYRNIISHEMEMGVFYNVDKKWQIGIELDYFATYNTHKLPLKLQHNKELVEAGQYSATQYHRVSDYMSQTCSLLLAVIYNFSGEASTVVR